MDKDRAPSYSLEELEEALSGSGGIGWLEDEERKEKQRKAASAKIGRVFMDGLSMEDGSSIDEAMDNIDRYFNVEDGCYVTDEQVIFFFDAIAIAGCEILRDAGLPADCEELAELEELFHLALLLQPKKPTYLCQSAEVCGYCELRSKRAYFFNKSWYLEGLEEWKVRHSEYWKKLDNEPEILLFSNDKLLAAFRLQEVRAAIVDAVIEKRLVAALANVTKFAMLAIRAGVFDKVTGFEKSNSKHREGADTTNSKFLKSRDECIKEAAKIWRTDPMMRMGEMLKCLEATLIDKRLVAPTPNIIKGYLIEAEKSGILTIPPDARKAGRPRNTPNR
jgi:hypothetical protein